MELQLKVVLQVNYLTATKVLQQLHNNLLKIFNNLSLLKFPKLFLCLIVNSMLKTIICKINLKNKKPKTVSKRKMMISLMKVIHFTMELINNS